VADTRRKWNDAIGCEMPPAEALAVLEQWARASEQLNQDQRAIRARLRQMARRARRRTYIITNESGPRHEGERAALQHLRLGLTAAGLI
jgi:hypothetical protein